VIGNIINSVIMGFNNLLFGTTASGYKRGGVDQGLKFYGNSLVGLMSAEMYRFYTGQYYKSLDKEMRGVLPLNAFQYQGNDPLTTLLSAKSNSTALNFKLTDICELSVYDQADKYKPVRKRVEVMSTVHIRQTPGKKEEGIGKELPQWKEGETAIVDNQFNLDLKDTDQRVIEVFGKDSDAHRLFIIAEISLQMLGAGEVTITAFGQDPSKYPMEQVTIWEGRFRNSAQVKESVRA